MTRKRFKLIYNPNTIIWDNFEDEEVFAWADDDNPKEIVNKMNELHEENEQLKQQNKMLRTNVGKLTDDGMTAKRFEFKFNDREYVYFYIIDNETGKEYKYLIDDELLKLLNELHEENQLLKERRQKDIHDFEELLEENEQLKQELFESEKECLMIDYRDNPIRRNDKIIDLKEEYKERFGRDFE